MLEAKVLLVLVVVSAPRISQMRHGERENILSCFFASICISLILLK